MEIFIDNVAYSVKPDQLKSKIADIIHSEEYSHHSTSPLNLDVFFFPLKSFHITQRGKLTFPTPEVGEQFLKDYGGDQPKKHITFGPRVLFRQSDKAPRKDVLDRIRYVPYAKAPAECSTEPEPELELESISIQHVQFGWECRDDVFSPEWEYDCGAPGITGGLVYNEAEREFRLEIDDGEKLYAVGILAAQVHWASAGVDMHGTPTIYFNLEYPPKYETDVSRQPFPLPTDETDLSNLSLKIEGLREITISDCINAINSIQPFLLALANRRRGRWQHLPIDNSHAEVSAYTSRSIRLVCRTSSDLDSFRRICRIARLHLQTSLFHVEHRHLFCPQIRDSYAEWCASLPFVVAFQVVSLTRELTLDLREMMSLRSCIDTLVDTKGANYVVGLLSQFATEAKKWRYEDSTNNPSGRIKTAEDLLLQCDKQFCPPDSSRNYPVSSDLFQCRHLTVTPTTIRLSGPLPERANRVLRLYPDNHDSFLRVRFVDETNVQFRFDYEVDGRGFIQRRVGSILREGISIAGKHFEFLAYTMSSLKEHAVWFVSEFVTEKGEVVNAKSIIEGIGIFDGLESDPKLTNCPARYGARISQAFTTTNSTESAEEAEIITEPDIKTSDGIWCFTDGIGTISQEYAESIWEKFCSSRKKKVETRMRPSVFQIRIMGSKGVLSVDSRLSGRVITLRPSMIKFHAPHSRDIEIAKVFNKPGSFYLNRYFIMILEGLGVPFDAFRDLQTEAIEDTNYSRASLTRSAQLMESHGLGASFRLPSVMLSLDKLGVGPLLHDEFWMRMLDVSVNDVLRGIKHHARIPVRDACTLVGVADIHGYLEEGQIFAHVVPANGQPERYLQGPILVSRSPTIHPGDVQIVHAIGTPPPGSSLESLTNCVVFSIKGSRPLPSYLGGGDLDGDEYCCIEDPSLHPPTTAPPARYAPAQRLTLDRRCTMSDVADFVTDYFSSDNVGIIASKWLITADQSEKGIFDEDCMTLSQLHSDAVDYPKNGLPVDFNRIPKSKSSQKPDWSAPETIPLGTNTAYYESQKAIGRLFREVKLPMQEKRSITQSFRENLRNDPVYAAVESRVANFIQIDVGDFANDTVSEMRRALASYASRLETICSGNTLDSQKAAMLTEEEAITGTIAAKCSQWRLRRDKISRLREQTSFLVRRISHQLSRGNELSDRKYLERAWVAYQIALLERNKGRFGSISFGWIALGEVFAAIRSIEQPIV